MKTKVQNILKLIFILAACTLWLVFVIHLWNSTRYGDPLSDSLFKPLQRLLSDPGRNKSIKIYIGLSGFLFFAFYCTVLLPDLMRRFFPLKGRKIRVFKIVIISLICAAAFIQLYGWNNISTPAILKWLNPGHDTKELLIRLNLWMVPVSLGLIIFTWVIPAVIKFFKNAPREHSLKPANIRKTLEFYGLLAMIALTVTVASAVLLAIVKVFAPTAPDVIIRMEKSDAVSAAGIFLTMLLAPVIEETAFRGLIQHHVKRALPERLYIIAVLVASVYFGLWHRNLGQFVYTAIWALLFGLIYNTTGKVRHTIFMHALGNLLAVLSFSTTSNAVLGKHVVLPAIRAWLMDLPLFPAILILILLILVIVVVMTLALYLASGRKGRLLRFFEKRST